MRPSVIARGWWVMFKQRLFRTAGIVAAVLIGVVAVVTGQSRVRTDGGGLVA